MGALICFLLNHNFLSFLCSPMGEVFRARLRQFPSLVTCCTIDWFSAWPEEALQAVATSFLNELPELDVSPTAMRGLVSMLRVCQWDLLISLKIFRNIHSKKYFILLRKHRNKPHRH